MWILKTNSIRSVPPEDPATLELVSLEADTVRGVTPGLLPLTAVFTWPPCQRRAWRSWGCEVLLSDPFCLLTKGLPLSPQSPPSGDVSLLRIKHSGPRVSFPAWFASRPGVFCVGLGPCRPPSLLTHWEQAWRTREGTWLQLFLPERLWSF